LTGTVRDSDAEFRNPFTIPWHVQRLTSRLYNISDDLEGGVATTPAPATPGTIPTIRIVDSYGYAVVPNPTSWYQVFRSGENSAWTFNRTVDPRESYSIQIDNSQPFAAETVDIGMIGYREEMP